jgi:hypothetical protein
MKLINVAKVRKKKIGKYKDGRDRYIYECTIPSTCEFREGDWVEFIGAGKNPEELLRKI